MFASTYSSIKNDRRKGNPSWFINHLVKLCWDDENAILLFIPLYLATSRKKITGIEHSHTYNTFDTKLASLVTELEREKILLA